jgi:flagella basal body P-ring formation protein FlgA
MRDSAHPGGPGVLVAEEFIQGNSRLEQSADRSHAVIRSGDRLTVEASSPVLDLRLEGIALSPAALGAQLRVRLVVSGKIVWAVALGPGRVAKESDTEIWQ